MIICGDCLVEMRKMESNSISCIVTDPPYGLGFMGKAWDVGLPHHEIWGEALRVVKPGGFLLAFGGTRTYHRLTCAIEDSGWKIRDCIMYLYGSGFPKSHNHFGLEGYGTALKPAYEPIIMAMKPCDGTFKENAEKWGQAGINIDGCRVAGKPRTTHKNGNYKGHDQDDAIYNLGFKEHHSACAEGRWPANVLCDEEAAKILDEQNRNPENSHSDSGGASRFFYCAKASSRERNEGCNELENSFISDGRTAISDTPYLRKETIRKNNHPTVKPLTLMEYLIKLVMPPKDGVLLDPFAGSGSTILAAHRLGVKALGIEKDTAYCEIARARLENAKNKPIQETFL